jgi:hypothetical protein
MPDGDVIFQRIINPIALATSQQQEHQQPE